MRANNIKVGDLVRWKDTVGDKWHDGAFLVVEVRISDFYNHKYNDLMILHKGDTYLISSLDCEVM